MITTVATASSKTIHASDAEGTTLCRAEAHRAAGSGLTRCIKFAPVTGEVTCKRCLKAVGGRKVEVKAEPVRTMACWNCDVAITGTVADHKAHAKSCIC